MNAVMEAFPFTMINTSLLSFSYIICTASPETSTFNDYKEQLLHQMVDISALKIFQFQFNCHLTVHLSPFTSLGCVGCGSTSE